MSVLLAIWRGLKWYIGGAALYVWSHLKEIHEAIKDIKELWEALKDLDFHAIVTKLRQIWNAIPIAEIWAWVIAVTLVSLVVWAVYTRPRDQMTKRYYGRLEQRRPGITKGRRKRQE